MLRAFSAAEHAILRITELDRGDKRTLILEGSLVDPWIGELERIWTNAQRTPGPGATVIDLRDVTAISERGEDLLLRMMACGATVNCRRGVLTRHVLQELARKGGAKQKVRSNCE